MWARIILKLAILAKEGISINILSEEPPDKFTLPLSQSMKQTWTIVRPKVRDLRIRIEQLKNAWFNKCQKIAAAGILCGNTHSLGKKQLKREPVEKFYGCLRELSINCDLGSHEESIICDVFIVNMQDGEMRKLLKETRAAKKALEPAINIKMGIQNQLKISGTTAYTRSNQLAN